MPEQSQIIQRAIEVFVHGFASKLAVLTASHAGALLYPIVEYQQIGTLLLYTQKRR